METVFNTDSSFFQITLPEKDNRNISTSVISLEVTETLGGIMSGTLSLNDPYHYYGSTLLPEGTEFDITFGYKTRLQNTKQLQITGKNTFELTGSGIRTGYKAVVLTPSWAASTTGQVTYNCTFYAFEYLQSIQETRVFDSGNKADAVSQIMDDLGVDIKYILFRKGNETCSPGTTAIMQSEANFSFLVQSAYDWKCIFMLSRNPAGKLVGLFTDNSKIGDPSVAAFSQLVTGAVGSSKILEYGIGSLANVISYSVQRHVGESGQGDDVTLQLINGKVITTTRVAPTEKVKTYKLDAKFLEAYLEDNQADEKEIMKDIYDGKALTSRVGKLTIKDFFKEDLSKTAPQGLGYSCNVEVIGDPTFGPPVEIKFGAGFPMQLRNPMDPGNKFYVKSVTHSFSSNGYRCRLGIADAITTYGGFVSG